MLKKDETFLKYYGKISETKKNKEKTTKSIDKRIDMLYNGNMKTTIPI